jgi:hypothetical protein
MQLIVRHIRSIMVLSGILTSSMVYAALAPQAALSAMFGDTLAGPLAEIIVRNWGALVALVGLLLIHGAFNPAARRVALVIAGASKLIFIGLVLTYGRPFLGGQAGLAVALDAVFLGLFAVYLLASRTPTAS